MDKLVVTDEEAPSFVTDSPAIAHARTPHIPPTSPAILPTTPALNTAAPPTAFDSPAPPEYSSFPRRRILIIGGGVAGLALALCLKRASVQTGLALDPIIFEASNGERYKESGPHYILWRWAVEVLLELGLGKRLSRIAWPIESFKSQDADTKETLVQWPPVVDPAAPGSTTAPAGTAAASDSSLPPMVGARQSDIMRLLMLALSDIRNDLLDSDKLSPSAANNSDTANDPVQGIEGDLARDNWFENEGWANLLPQLRLGYDLDSFLISATSGLVTARFTNGHVEQGTMLIGADGLYSKVRDLLLSGRAPPQFASAMVISGITRLNKTPSTANPEDEIPTELEDHRPIPDLTSEDVYTFCPDGTALSVIGRGSSFGVTNIGNGMIGWSLVADQTEPGQHVEKFILEKRRRALSQHLAANPRSSLLVNAPLHVPGEKEKDAFGGSAVTAVSDSTTSASSGPLSMKTAFEQQLEDQQKSPSSPTSALPSLLEPVRNQLTGADARTLALRLCMPLPLPHPICHSIIARTDPNLTFAHDAFDLAEEHPPSYTSRNYHPGRVMLIGDAAHAITPNAHGSLGAGLALTDAATLAKLIGKWIDPYGTEDDEAAIAQVGEEFDSARVGVCGAIVKEARSEGGWGRMENGWVRSLLRLSYRYTPVSWTRATYDQMLTRGRVLEGEEMPSLAPIWE
ncbi:hypothetical protein HK102_001050 [Quaeritorhiza haematococci]|nr:hypothetical protein HK102_001050 [Quaeritorhiza haematococci]